MGLSVPGFGGGDFVSSALGFAGQERTNRSNVKLAREQMKFQSRQADIDREFTDRMAREAEQFSERMSSTAYQRAVTDLKSAGINPMLAYMRGGSSSPAGFAGTSKVPTGASAKLENSVTPALNAALKNQELKNLKQQQKTQKAVELLNEANTHSAVALANKTNTENQLLKNKVPQSDIEAEIYRSSAGEIFKWLKELRGSVPKFGFGKNKRSKD